MFNPSILCVFKTAPHFHLPQQYCKVLGEGRYLQYKHTKAITKKQPLGKINYQGAWRKNEYVKKLKDKQKRKTLQTFQLGAQFPPLDLLKIT